MRDSAHQTTSLPFQCGRHLWPAVTLPHEMSTDIPIIDFARAASSPEQLAGELLAACTDWGRHKQCMHACDGKGAMWPC
jgi:hypothetical protein